MVSLHEANQYFGKQAVPLILNAPTCHRLKNLNISSEFTGSVAHAGWDP